VPGELGLHVNAIEYPSHLVLREMKG
jgi:hypothetical protein